MISSAPPATDHPTFTRDRIEQFLYREARHADESDYDAWESLWTDDAIYWVPADDPDSDPNTTVSVIFDNRSRISTRLKQLRTGKRYAQAPASQLRRVISNVEVIGEDPATAEVEVAANFLLFESKARGSELWGGRTTYRLRAVDGEIRLAYKKVVLVGLDKPLATLGFLI
ncbi:MAG TPA: aromatic-ring-hydroxylating dioxygenase subunit beta [Mycobacteriales bacterium]|jgi:3-phenylpropionate/cinnamic acid dioxygenase small subunit|nr:aromatic-ring-hydroxylating dioxygenase subunit beta [Mycobacteriales bacterium]